MAVYRLSIGCYWFSLGVVVVLVLRCPDAIGVAVGVEFAFSELVCIGCFCLLVFAWDLGSGTGCIHLSARRFVLCVYVCVFVCVCISSCGCMHVSRNGATAAGCHMHTERQPHYIMLLVCQQVGKCRDAGGEGAGCIGPACGVQS